MGLMDSVLGGKMEEYISKLKEIKKDELSEREFYERVLTILDNIDGEKRLTEEEHLALKTALLDIGCQRTSDWKIAKQNNGVEIPVYRGEGEGIEKAHIESGVNMVSQLLSDHYTAVFGMSLMATGSRSSWMKQWVENSKQKHRSISISAEMIARLKEIDKSNMSEQEFYEQVISTISDLKDIKLTSEIYEELKTTLLEIGCKRIEDWNDEKRAEGVSVGNVTLGDGIETGDIEIGVNMVSQLLTTYEDAEFALPYMFHKNDELGWSQKWLEASRRFHLKDAAIARIQGKIQEREGLKNRVKEQDKTKKDNDGRTNPNEDGEEFAD